MSRPPRRAVLLQHDLPVSPGALGPALAAAGFTLEHRLRELQPGDVEADLVVVLGGFMGVYEANQHAYLREELALLETRLARERPSLGICLGAQMLAAVAGARALAGSERQPQEAFALDSALGMLFHPEVEPATFEAWVRTFPEALQRADRRLEDVLAHDLPRLHAAMPHTRAFLASLATQFAVQLDASRL